MNATPKVGCAASQRHRDAAACEINRARDDGLLPF